jgi:hypothetical protein
VPFVVAELGPEVDPFVLHLYAALAEKKRALISTRDVRGDNTFGSTPTSRSSADARREPAPEIWTGR